MSTGTWYEITTTRTDAGEEITVDCGFCTHRASGTSRARLVRDMRRHLADSHRVEFPEDRP